MRTSLRLRYLRGVFEKFIHYIQSKGSTVVIFLPSYHPTSYDLLMKNSKYMIIKDVEIYLNNFASFSVEIFGSYNPHKYNFTNIDFIDGMHSFDYVIEEVFKEYKKQLSI